MFGSSSTKFLAVALLSTFLVACGGGSDSDSSDSGSDSGSGSVDSGSGFSGTTQFSNSLLSGKRFYGVFIEGGANDPYGIATFLFDGNSVKVGDGYIESSDSDDYFFEEHSWQIQSNGNLLIDLSDSDETVTATVTGSDTDYIKACFEDSGEQGSCHTEFLFTDKAKAKKYIADNSPIGADINLGSITDTKLNKVFQDLEYDYAEQVYEIVLPDFGIKSLAGLGQFSELYRLEVQDNHITDISALSGLNNMEYLNLRDQADSSSGDDVNLASYDSIYGMHELTQLYLNQYGSNVTPTKFELDSLLASSNVKSDISVLAFYGVALDNDDVTAITSLPSLRVLAMDEGEITDLTSWSNNWSKLEQLRVGWNSDNSSNKVSFDLNAMISSSLSLSQLTKLELAKTTLTETDLATIAAGVGSNLRYLDLRSTNIASYSNLDNANMPNLERLKLRPSSYGTGAYDLSGTLPFTVSKLTQLYLEDGDISNFTISDFSSLTKLQISGSNVIGESVSSLVNSLNSLSGFKNLVIRRSTKLSGTTIRCSDLTGLNSGISCRDT